VTVLDDEARAWFVTAQQRGPDRHPSSARRIITIRRCLLARGHLGIAVPQPPPLTRVNVELQVGAAWQEAEQCVGPGTIADGRSGATRLISALAGTATPALMPSGGVLSCEGTRVAARNATFERRPLSLARTSCPADSPNYFPVRLRL